MIQQKLLRILLFMVILFGVNSHVKAQTLASGDIAIVGVNTDGPNASTDEISIVTLATIPTGTTIYFSDYYWDNTNTRWGNDGLNGTIANTTEGIIKWTTTAPISSGTVYRISWTMGSGTPSVSGLPGTVTLFGQTGTTTAGPLGSGSDNIFIYQSNNNGVTPSNWVFGWTNGLSTSVSANNAWQTSNTPIAGNLSMLPSALTNGVNAVSFAQVGSGTAFNPSFDNNVYNVGSIRTGTKAQILAGICTPSNWTGDETTPYDISPTSSYYTGANAFTVGVLPVKWLYINGNTNAQKQANINFKVNENNVVQYVIEKSNDGRSFAAIGNLNSIGNGENMYRFTDAQTVNDINYYRVKQIDVDGRFSFSPIVKLSATNNNNISVYPNPVGTTATISGATVGSQIQLVDVTGKLLQSIRVTNPTFTIDMSGYSKGLYLLQGNNQVIKIVKE